MPTSPEIRRFDGSLADAQAILATEHAAWSDSPYSAEQVHAMLTRGPQRAWLAIVDAQVAGFVIAFATHGLQEPRWEIDLLAVHPSYRRQGLATALIRAATAFGAGQAARARAFVATDNAPSARAFHRAGFVSQPETRALLIHRAGGSSPHRPLGSTGITVRPTTDVGKASAWLPDKPTWADHPGMTLLLAEQDGEPAGYAELLQVETLLYRGVWIEALSAPQRPARDLLIHEAMALTSTRGLQELGAMVPASEWRLREALVSMGFRSLGDFYWFSHDLEPPT
jgi:ribosomal protein S18 acetylase RimI-like enzyme